MDRLIRKAEELDEKFKATRDENGELAYSYSEIVDAIHIVQTEMGITGTTAQEAASTIGGSVSTMKSSWSNLVTGIANENANVDKLMEEFVESVATVGENILPHVRTALEGAAKLVSKLAPVIAKELPKLMKNILPDLANATANLIISLAEQIPSMIEAVIEAAEAVVDEIGNIFAEKIPALAFVFENLETIVWAVVNAFIAYKAAMLITSIISALSIALEGATIAQIALNTAMNMNPIGILVTAIALLVTALASEESAIKSVADAQKDLNEAQKEYAQAETNYTNAIKRIEKATEDLRIAEEKTGYSGSFLADAVDRGAMSYSNMSKSQREAYDAYLELQNAQEELKTTTTKFEEAKVAENEAHWDSQLALAAESGSYDEYKDSVLKAYKEGRISAETAQKALSKAMSGMSLSSMKTFVEDIPENIRTGLDPTETMSLLDEMNRTAEHGFADAIYIVQNWSDISKSIAQSGWDFISGLFSSIGEWFGARFTEAKNAVVGAWFDIETKIGEIWEKITGAFDIDDAKDWGKNMIDKFINGIKEKLPNLFNFLGPIGKYIANIFGFDAQNNTPPSGGDNLPPGHGSVNSSRIEASYDVTRYDFGERAIKAEPANASSGQFIENVNINIDGSKYDDARSLAEAISEALQEMTDRRVAVYA
jgi:hypothetical protein